VNVGFLPTQDQDYKATLLIEFGGPIPRTIELVGDGDNQFF
jgi:hypothetical protein